MNSRVHKVNRPSFLRRLICELDARIGGIEECNKLAEKRGPQCPQHNDVINIALVEYGGTRCVLQQRGFKVMHEDNRKRGR